MNTSSTLAHISSRNNQATHGAGAVSPNFTSFAGARFFRISFFASPANKINQCHSQGPAMYRSKCFPNFAVAISLGLLCSNNASSTLQMDEEEKKDSAHENCESRNPNACAFGCGIQRTKADCVIEKR